MALFIFHEYLNYQPYVAVALGKREEERGARGINTKTEKGGGWGVASQGNQGGL